MFEALEPRRLLAGTAEIIDRVLTIIGTDGDDWIAFDQINDVPGGTRVVRFIGDREEYFPRDDFDSILIRLGDGNDTVGGAGAQEDAEIHMGSGNDSVYCTYGNNLVYGDGGRDTIMGNSSFADTLIGGNGNDSILSYGGNDVIKGQSGNDRLDGGDGNDTIRGGDGDDLLRGQQHNDRLDGDAGCDRMRGGSGDDRLFADSIEPPGTLPDDVHGGIGIDFARVDPDDVLKMIERTQITPAAALFSSTTFELKPHGFGDLMDDEEGLLNLLDISN